MKTLILITGIVIFLIGLITKIKKNKYDFENRTDGGVVRHKSYGSTITHKLGKGIADLMMIGGVLLIGYSFIYDPYSGKYPSNWNSMTDRQKQTWKYYQSNPEEAQRKISETTIRPYQLLKGKKFDDWTKQMEKETEISSLVWRDIADETEKEISFSEQEKLMDKWHFNRAMVKAVKNEYEFDPNDPLDVWRAEQAKREKNKSEK